MSHPHPSPPTASSSLALRSSALLLAAALWLGALPPAAAQDDLRATTARSRAVAERYFDAYIARRWDELEPLLADQAEFSDPTAASVWPGIAKQGKVAVMRGFREGYATLVDMRYTPLRTFATGPHVVFEGELDWSIRVRDGRVVRSAGPFVVHLEVHDGRVTRHQDLLDYQPFVDALKAR